MSDARFAAADLKVMPPSRGDVGGIMPSRAEMFVLLDGIKYGRVRAAVFV